MKRLIAYISILAAVLTAGVSCSREAVLDGEQEGGNISLVFKAAQMATRVDIDKNAGKVAGEGAENVIDHVDYFFFADEDPESEAIVSGRLTSADLTQVAEGEYKTADHFIDTATEGYEALKGPSYFYALVNYPEEVTAKTMKALLALPISTDFTKAQTSFVMDSFSSEAESGLIYLTPKSSAEDRTEVVKVSRIAAKLVLNINVAESFEDATHDVWTPVLDQMWVNFLYARKTATVAATPMAFDAKTNYYNTDQAMPNGGTLTDGFYKYTTDPVYTYPLEYETSDVTAPYFKIFIPWLSKLKGMNNFYYKVILPELGSFQRNKIYQLNVDVSVIGGTEDDWALFSDYVYVADWYSPGEIATSVESARYLDVPVKKHEIYGINSIEVPVVSSNDIEIVSVSARQQTVRETNGSTSATHPIRSYTCVPNGSESFTLTYNLDATITNSTNTSFDCTPIEWTVTIRHKQTADEPYLPKQVTVTIIQYPSIHAKLIEGGDSFINGYYSVQTGSVYNHPSSENTWTSGGVTYYRWRNSNNLYSGPQNTENGSYGRLNQDVSAEKGSTMTIITVTAFAQGSDTYKVYSNGTTTGNPSTTNTTEFEYIIGDPRIPWNSLDRADLQGNNLIPAAGLGTLNPYLNGGGNDLPPTTTAWQNVSNIMVTGTQQNLIAPAYMFNSDRGGRPGNNGVVYENAVKRCATYQEAGYPAGRWRLPTEAELYFAYSLQHMDVIPHLFNGGAGYHASTGNIFDWTANNGVGQAFRDPGTSVHSIRCVYDIWYWGEAPAVTGDDVHRFYPGTLN